MNKRWIVAVAILAVAIVLPVGGMALALLHAPQPYRLIAEPGPQWRSGQALGADGRAMVRVMADEAAARRAARQVLESTPTVFSSSMPGVHRYRAAGSGEHGLILALDRYVVLVAAPDQAALDRAVAALAFMAPDPGRTGLARALDRHPVAVMAGVAGYALLLVLLASRTLAWAARRQAPAGLAAASPPDLRQRLLALELPGISVQAREDGQLVFERAGDGVLERVRLRLDDGNRVVRALAGGSTRGRRFLGLGMGFFKYWWRTMPSGPHSERIAEVVLASGWTWQPVFTFVRTVGG